MFFNSRERSWASHSIPKPSTRVTVNQTSSSKIKYELKRKRNFVPAWLDKFVWLIYGDKENIMWCETCRTYADHADKTSSLFQGTDTFRIEPLQAHNRSLEHIVCELKHARVRHSQLESQSETHSSSQPLGPTDKVLQKFDHEADMQLQF